MKKDEPVYCTRCRHLVYSADGTPRCRHENECDICTPGIPKPFRDRTFYYEKAEEGAADRYFSTKDIRTLYEAFSKLCDFIEKDGGGCNKCPMHEICYSKASKGSGVEFAKTLTRIRVTANIPEPTTD